MEELQKEFNDFRLKIKKQKKKLSKSSKSSQSDEIKKQVAEEVVVADEAQKEESKVAAELVPLKEPIKTGDADQKITEQQPINIDTTYSRGIDCYFGQNGVEQDFEEATKLFQQAADGGHIWAMDALGCCYAEGKGVEQDYEKAIELFQRAVGGDNISCMEKLAICYYNVGDDKYSEKVRELVRLAIDNNDFETINILGVCYAEGKCVKQNFEEAAKLFQQAADNGNVLAMENLARCYVEGLGVEKNFEEAYELCQEAQEKGTVIDQALLLQIQEAELQQTEQKLNRRQIFAAQAQTRFLLLKA